MGRELRRTDEGFTIHETVSDTEQAISPTFATKEQVVEYLIGEGFTETAAENFVNDGWSPSMIYHNGRVIPAIACCEFLGDAHAKKLE